MYTQETHNLWTRVELIIQVTILFMMYVGYGQRAQAEERDSFPGCQDIK